MMILGQYYKEVKETKVDPKLELENYINFLELEWIEKGFKDEALEIRIEEAKKILKMLEKRGA